MLAFLFFFSLVMFAVLVAAALAGRSPRVVTSGLSRADELALQRRFSRVDPEATIPMHGSR